MEKSAVKKYCCSLCSQGYEKKKDLEEHQKICKYSTRERIEDVEKSITLLLLNYTSVAKKMTDFEERLNELNKASRKTSFTGKFQREKKILLKAVHDGEKETYSIIDEDNGTDIHLPPSEVAKMCAKLLNSNVTEEASPSVPATESAAAKSKEKPKPKSRKKDEDDEDDE